MEKKYTEMTFEEKIHKLAEESVIKIAENGDWFTISYENRVKLPPELYRDVWNMLDVEEIKRKLKTRIEQELADRLVNNIAAELSSDIKALLSNKERRDEIREIANKHLLHLTGWKKETN